MVAPVCLCLTERMRAAKASPVSLTHPGRGKAFPHDRIDYVADGTTIKTLTQTVDASMTAEFQSLLNRAKSMIDDTTYAGTGITVVEEAYERAEPYFTVDANGNPVADPTITRAQLCPIVKFLETKLNEAQDKIDEIVGQQ